MATDVDTSFAHRAVQLLMGQDMARLTVAAATQGGLPDPSEADFAWVAAEPGKAEAAEPGGSALDVQAVSQLEVGRTADVLAAHATTLGGSARLRALLVDPAVDPAGLARRAAALEAAAARDPAQADAELGVIRRCEPAIAWATSPRTPEESELLEMTAFSGVLVEWLNGVPGARRALNLHRIVACPLLALLQPLIYVGVLYMAARASAPGLRLSTFLHVFRMSMVDRAGRESLLLPVAVSLAVYAHGVFSTAQVAQMLYATNRTAWERVAGVYV
jgi:hypothetical protein